MSDRVTITCNGAEVDLDAAPGESLLSVLRERLGMTSVKDGCAPQGQCGCCTVLVDGEPRVACVTPVSRVAGRSITTVEGLDPDARDALGAAFVATGGSQCGFCTPGIVMRAAALIDKGKTRTVDLDRALAAHLCRCTGWRTVYDAIAYGATDGAVAVSAPPASRDLDTASQRAELEGGVTQRVGADVPLGGGGFADDTAPTDAMVAVPVPPGVEAADAHEVEGVRWVVADTLLEARDRAGKVQGRRTTIDEAPPLPLPARPAGGVRLATSWVEPGYLEPDASWCTPGGEPASPLANGGAFGGKQTSPAPAVARALADRFDRPVRVVLAREDVVRLGPKRSPMAATAVLDDGGVVIDGQVAAGPGVHAFLSPLSEWPYKVTVEATWAPVAVPGPPTGHHVRAAGLAEHVVLVEGALTEAGADRLALVRDARAAAVLLDNCVVNDTGAGAGARVHIAESGAIERVEVRVAAGDPLDDVVLRSYAMGAAHMALGWVLSEGIAVDPATGEVHDLTIRSFGILRAKDTPPIDVAVIDDPGSPRARSSDAVFAAVAAATWNALAATEGERPETFPARATRVARRLRR